MSSFSHEKLNRLKLPRIKPLESNYTPRTRWLPIGFGPHYGETMPTILFTDPAHLGVLAEGDIIRTHNTYGIELNRQARVVWNRAENLVAHKRFGSKTQFVVIADGADVFERVLLLPKTARPNVKLAPGSKIVKCCRELAVSIVCDFDNEILGLKRMGRSLRKIYTSKNAEYTRKQQYERAMQNDLYCNVSSILQDAYL